MKQGIRRAPACCAGLVVWSTLWLAGCDRSPYELAPVEGRVTIDGRPMTQGRVMFAPISDGTNVNPGKPAFGPIDADGHYYMQTYATRDGAVVGDHFVTIYDTSSTPRFNRVMLPERRTVVGDEDNRIDIELTGADIKRYGIQVAKH